VRHAAQALAAQAAEKPGAKAPAPAQKVSA